MYLKFFADLDKRKLTRQMDCHGKLLGKLKLESMDKNNLIIKKGDPPNKFYIVIRGNAIVLGHRDENMIRQDRRAAKFVVETCKTKTINAYRLEEWYNKNIKDIPSELRKFIGFIDNLNEGFIRYKKSHIEGMFGGVNPYDLDKKADVFEPKVIFFPNKKVNRLGS